MKEPKDMTQKQFDAALERRGIVYSEYDFGLGYMQKPPMTVNISRFNGGPTRRKQLAYLIKAFDKHERIEANAKLQKKSN